MRKTKHLCKSCKKDCKQSEAAIVIKCPDYVKDNKEHKLLSNDNWNKSKAEEDQKYIPKVITEKTVSIPLSKL